KKEDVPHKPTDLRSRALESPLPLPLTLSYRVGVAKTGAAFQRFRLEKAPSRATSNLRRTSFCAEQRLTAFGGQSSRSSYECFVLGRRAWIESRVLPLVEVGAFQIHGSNWR